MAEVDVQEWNKKVGQITAKAWSDEAFKKRLTSDPNAVMKEYGLEAPAGVKIKIVEDTDTLSHLCLPPKPTGKELSEEDLAAVAGGAAAAAARRSCRTVQTGL
jgi:hypothetical protein